MRFRDQIAREGHSKVTPAEEPKYDVEAAQRAFDRNRARVVAGETFRSQRRTAWKPGKSPSSSSKRSR